MTLEVSLLGEEAISKRFKSSIHYISSSMISGSLTGFLYTLLIFILFSWLPFLIKMLVFISIVVLYLLNELKIIKIKTPQREWQIPASWVRGSTTKNMWVWGLVLGAGIFTYMPYVTFYLMYMYIGLFLNPTYGLLYGLIYGFSRALPTILITIKNSELEMLEIKKLYMKKTRMFKVLNGLSLFTLFLFLITTTFL